MKTRSKSAAPGATDPFAHLDPGSRIVSSLRLGLVLALTVVPWSFFCAEEIDWSGRAKQDIAAAYRAEPVLEACSASWLRMPEQPHRAVGYVAGLRHDPDSPAPKATSAGRGILEQATTEGRTRPASASPRRATRRRRSYCSSGSRRRIRTACAGSRSGARSTSPCGPVTWLSCRRHRR